VKRKKKEQRRDRRVPAALPVKVGRAAGVTRDVSASGMFLETDASYAVGSTVNLMLNLDTPWGKVMFNCRGRIVRREAHDHRMGVAVQFIDPAELPAPSSARRAAPAAKRTRKASAKKRR
jgi:hypothetical protein